MQKLNVSGIYSLSCPKSGRVRYIGQSKNIRKRYMAHLNSRDRSQKDEWVKSLLKDGLKPVIRVEEATDRLNEAEKKHIQKHGIANLLNIHHGGEFEGRKDPLPWRVIGVSHPSKLMAITCRNRGVRKDVIDDVLNKARECKSIEDRMTYELKCASILAESDLSDRIERWFSVVYPRLSEIYPQGELDL